MQLYSFRNLSDAIFLLVALTLAVSSFLLIASTLVDHLRNYKYPTLQVCCTSAPTILAGACPLCSCCVTVNRPVEWVQHRDFSTTQRPSAGMLHENTPASSYLRHCIMVYDGVHPSFGVH